MYLKIISCDVYYLDTDWLWVYCTCYRNVKDTLNKSFFETLLIIMQFTYYLSNEDVDNIQYYVSIYSCNTNYYSWKLLCKKLSKLQQN